jgi:hypothetical protein
MDPAAAHPACRRGAGRRSVAARNQVRRLPHARAPRSRRGAAADRTGLDWTHKYPAIAKAVAALPATRAYLDGELCGVFPDGITSFSMIQAASDAGNAAGLVFFIFDLLHLDGEDIAALPLVERKSRLAELLSGVTPPLPLQRLSPWPGPGVP